MSSGRPGRRRLRRVRTAVGERVEARLHPEAATPLEQYQRLALNLAVDRYLEGLRVEDKRAAEISGANHSHLQWREHRSLDYPEYDLCGDMREAGRYDVVICEQVLEHVADPWLAARNLRQLTEPGGHLIVSTPFLIRIHELPEYGMRDYWRFTPRGLRELLERAGLEVEALGSWGNRSGVVANLRHWSKIRPWHDLDNDPALAVQVWAFARAPSAGADGSGSRGG